MKAVLRIWWMFFAAFPVQRRLAIAGAVLCGLFVSTGLTAGQDFWMLGPLALFIFVACPAAIAGPTLVRALSAPRMHQLLPRFRPRMLGALGLLVVSVFGSFALFAYGPVFFSRIPVTAFGYADLALLAGVYLIWPFIYMTAAFLLLFLASGDWRWAVAIPAAIVGLDAAGEAGRRALASASLLWLAAAVLAWTVFAAWYLRARTIGPVAFTPVRKIAASRPVENDGLGGRDAAIGAILAAGLRRPMRGLGDFVGTAVAAVIFLVAVTPMVRAFSFTSFVWPSMYMGIFGAIATRAVHRSRLLWLHVPGARQDVRKIVERSLWRAWAMGLSFLAIVAALYASPLGGATVTEMLCGFAMAAAAGVYGTYVMFAALPSLATQMCGIGLMGAAYLVLLWRAAQSPTTVLVLTAAALVGALLLRALAIRRWERIDWLRVRPIAGIAGALQ